MSSSSATIADSESSYSPEPTEDKIFWPADLLAQDLPQARIWTYGYNADVLAGMFQMNNKNSISQHGRDLAARFERDVDNDVRLFTTTDCFAEPSNFSSFQSSLWPIVWVALSSKM